MDRPIILSATADFALDKIGHPESVKKLDAQSDVSVSEAPTRRMRLGVLEIQILGANGGLANVDVTLCRKSNGDSRCSEKFTLALLAGTTANAKSATVSLGDRPYTALSGDDGLYVIVAPDAGSSDHTRVYLHATWG